VFEWFGFAFGSNSSDHAFELYSIAYSRAQKHDRSWLNEVAISLDDFLYGQGKLAEGEVLPENGIRVR
jgi:hypothetical protein